MMGDEDCLQFLPGVGLDSPVSINGSTAGPLAPGSQLAPGGVSAWRAQFDPETTLVPELF